MVEKTLEVPGKEAEASVFQVCRFGELITLSDTKGLYVPRAISNKDLEHSKKLHGCRAGWRGGKEIPHTHGVRAGQQSAKNAIGFIEVYNILQNHAIMLIGREEGVKGYWKGNLPQVIRIVPYSAVQLFAYEAYKAIILFWGEDGQLSVLGAGACAGMTSTLITYPLDVLRLRLAVEPGYRTMSQGKEIFAREKYQKEDTVTAVVAIATGVIGLYRGFIPNALKMPNSSIKLTTFDIVNHLLVA
ncbi:hypothetical protein DY000_02000908 [Brassica cretica]|uniref:Uncharacterized protein n=1 Tax=Brassica cretica TaxID=69181 RepID=A0ABQ7CAB7_BRACR|nr:hypothetical protein DY000_02000908 [Brassica cretica]